MQAGDREHPEQLRAGMVTGPLQLVECVVTPGMNPSTPMTRNAAATSTAAPCTAMSFGRRRHRLSPFDPVIDGSAG